MPDRSKAELAKLSRRDRAGLHLILAVAALWVALVAVVQLYVTLVLVQQLPASVLVYVPGKGTAYATSQWGVSDLVLVSWLVIAAYAVIVGIAAVFQFRGAFWPVVVGTLVCASLPFVAAAVFLSLFDQVGLPSPASSLSSSGEWSASLGGFLFLFIGLLSAFAIPRWVIGWVSNRRGTRV
jgi:hypothetical protein